MSQTLTSEAHAARSESPRAGLGPRVPALDGLRGLAVLMVVLSHYCVPANPDATMSPASAIFFQLMASGGVGVDLFFVLSGFLITGILYDSRRTTHYFRDFYARRALRIFPLYYGVLAFIFFVAPQFRPLVSPYSAHTPDHPAWLWLYAVNICTGLKTPPDQIIVSDWLGVAHFWSLSVEEHFYLLWPAVVLFCNRRALLRLSAGVMVAAFALRVVLYSQGEVYPARWFTPCILDSLAVGSFLAAAVRGEGGIAPLKRPAKWGFILGGIALVAIQLSVFLVPREVARPIILTCTYAVLAVFFGSLLVLALSAPRERFDARLWHSLPLRFLGKISYGLYVYHFLFEPLLREWFSSLPVPEPATNPVLNSLLFTLVAGGACIVFSVASWHLYEAPFLKLKTFFDYRNGTDRGERAEKAP